MAAISSIDGRQIGDFSAPITTLSADDTITFSPGRKQLLILRNTTGGSLTATIAGSTATTVSVNGVGSVDVSAGKAIVVAAGLSRAVVLGTISAYCSGVVHITGASGLTAQLIEL